MSKIIFADRQLSVDMTSFIGHVLAQMGYERNQVFGFLTSANMSNRPETFGGMALPGRSPNMSMYALWLFECLRVALYSLFSLYPCAGKTPHSTAHLHMPAHIRSIHIIYACVIGAFARVHTYLLQNYYIFLNYANLLQKKASQQPLLSFFTHFVLCCQFFYTN